MKNKISYFFVLLFSLVLILPLHVKAEELPFSTLPTSDSYIYNNREMNSSSNVVMYSMIPEDIVSLLTMDKTELQNKYGYTDLYLSVQFDWSVDNESSWHVSDDWDPKVSGNKYSPMSVDIYYNDRFVETEVFTLTDEFDRSLFDTTHLIEENGGYRFDYTAHSLYIRNRYVLQFQKTTGENEFYVSEWTNATKVSDETTLTINKDSLTAPQVTNMRLDNSSGRAILYFDMSIPQTIKNTSLILKALDGRDFEIMTQVKVGTEEWKDIIIEQNNVLYGVTNRSVVVSETALANDAVIELKVKLNYQPNGSVNVPEVLETAWSNVATTAKETPQTPAPQVPTTNEAEESCLLGIGICCNKIAGISICIFIVILAVAAVGLIVFDRMNKKKKLAAPTEGSEEKKEEGKETTEAKEENVQVEKSEPQQTPQEAPKTESVSTEEKKEETPKVLELNSDGEAAPIETPKEEPTEDIEVMTLDEETGELTEEPEEIVEEIKEESVESPPEQNQEVKPEEAKETTEEKKEENK